MSVIVYFRRLCGLPFLIMGLPLIAIGWILPIPLAVRIGIALVTFANRIALVPYGAIKD